MPHLRSLIADQDGIVRIDRDPRIDIVRTIGVVVSPRRCPDSRGAGGAWRGADADHETAGGGCCGEDEVAAAESRSDVGSVHRDLSLSFHHVGGAMNGAAQTLIGSAPADIRDVGVDIGIGRIGEVFQECDGGHDLP